MTGNLHLTAFAGILLETSGTINFKSNSLQVQNPPEFCGTMTSVTSQNQTTAVKYVYIAAVAYM
jgi:hypothetical protein